MKSRSGSSNKAEKQLVDIKNVMKIELYLIGSEL